jgi:hypothetical protein
MAQQLQLPDGRMLDYSVSGAQGGFPLLFLHGTPGAWGVFSDMELACKNKNLKLITTSRAGYGSSTRLKGRRVIDVVQDLKYLLGHLNVERCLVAGWSGGGKAKHPSRRNDEANIVPRTACTRMRSTIAWMRCYSGTGRRRTLGWGGLGLSPRARRRK